MNSIKTLTSLKALTYLAVGLFMFLSSCKDNAKIDYTATDAANVEGETTSDSFSSDAQETATDAVSGISDTQLGGRADGSAELVTTLGDNDRLKCATVTITRTGTKDAPAGVITITFPADGTCKDGRGNVRRGTITITYTGRKFIPGSKIITTFTDYSINGIKIEGTHTLTNVTPTTEGFPRFNITIVGGKVTFLSGKTVTREQNFTREWQRAATPAQDKWVLLAGGTASGSNREGKVYSMQITKDLVYSRACQISNKVFIAVSGSKEFTSGDKKVTIDFGDGTCDNMVTITIGGQTKTVEVKGDGN